MKFALEFILPGFILISCVSPSPIAQTRPTLSYKGEIIGDPYRSPNAPLLISSSQIAIVNQPSPPPYPSDAKNLGIQGDVLIEIWINENGVPTNAFALAGPSELRETAVLYAKQWKFSLINPNPIKTTFRFRMVMPFRLRIPAAPVVYLPQVIRL